MKHILLTKKHHMLQALHIPDYDLYSDSSAVERDIAHGVSGESPLLLHLQSVSKKKQELHLMGTSKQRQLKAPYITSHLKYWKRTPSGSGLRIAQGDSSGRFSLSVCGKVRDA